MVRSETYVHYDLSVLPTPIIKVFCYPLCHAFVYPLHTESQDTIPAVLSWQIPLSCAGPPQMTRANKEMPHSLHSFCFLQSKYAHFIKVLE